MYTKIADTHPFTNTYVYAHGNADTILGKSQSRSRKIALMRTILQTIQYVCKNSTHASTNTHVYAQLVRYTTPHIN